MNRLLIVSLACVVLAGCGGADFAFYHPDSKVYGTPARDGLVYEDFRFPSGDGTMLSGWFIPSTTPARGTVVHFHGNAQNMTSHYSFVSWVPRNGFNLFLFDYRGYGDSDGKPNRKGVHQDCLAAIKYFQARDDVDAGKIIVFGQSLGGANAIAVVGGEKLNGIVGVVSDSAFSSYEEVGKDHVAGSLKPLAGSLVSAGYDPIDVVGRISPIPLVIMHGSDDKVVPYHHAERLYARAKAPRELWTFHGGKHTDALGVRRRETVSRLLKCFRIWTKTDKR